MTSKLVVNTIEADTGISSVSFASSISMSSTSKFHFSNAGIDIGADTNINRPTAGVLGFNINDAEKFRIDSSGHIQVNTTSKGLATYGEDLTIASPDHGGITIRTGTGHKGTVYFSDATSGAGEYRGSIQYDHADNSLRLAANSSVRLFINSSGLVNIGAGSSASGLSPLLHLHKNASNDSAYLHITNNDTGITNNDGFLLGINPSGDCLVFNKDSTPIRFATAGIERLRITSAGRLGIGEDSPDSLLHLKAGNDRSSIRLENTYDTPDNVWEIQPGISGVSNTGFCIRDITDSANRFVINGSGNIGFNDNSPANFTGYTNLSIHGSTGGAITFGDDGTDEWEIYGGDGVLKVYDRANTSERLRISSNGAVSINHAGTGDNSLHIGCTSNAGGIIIKATGNHYANMVIDSNRSGANNGIFNLAGRWNGNDVAYISFTTGTDTSNKDDGYIRMYTRESGQSLTERVQIKEAGGFVSNKGGGNIPFSDGYSAIEARSPEGTTQLTVTNTTYESGTFDNEAGIWFKGNYSGNDERAKTAIIHKNTGDYGVGDLYFCLDGTGDNSNATVSDVKMKIDSSGRVTKPETPCFIVRHSSAETYSANSYIDGPWTVTLNRGNHFNTSNGVFTTPVAGLYQLNMMMNNDYNSSTTSGNFKIYVNNSLYAGMQFDPLDSHNRWFTHTLTGTLNLSANDTVRLYSGTSCRVDNYNWNHWSMYLVG